MKFQVRDGFVAKITNRIDVGDNKFELQENTIYGGQVVDLTAEQADLHAQKLEPKDRAATEYLAAKVAPKAPGADLGLSPEALALVKALASEMAKELISAAQASAQPAA